jgi:hypothetical protein
MRNPKVILVAAMAIFLSGCVLKGKPKTVPPAPAPPQPVASAPSPEPLSIAQTQQDLPEWQPLNPNAWKEPPAPVQLKPVTPTTTQPKPYVPQGPRATEPVTEPAAAPPPEPRRPIQEILPEPEKKQFQENADRNKAEVSRLLSAAGRRALNANENTTIEKINQLVKQSDQAESSGDMRAADEFAEKAHILAQELQGGK